MKKLTSALAVLAALGCLAGCTSKPQYGERKEDWAKRPPPPEWFTKGQPPAGANGPMSGPAGVQPGQAAGPVAPRAPGH